MASHEYQTKPRCDFRHLTTPLHKVMTVAVRGHDTYSEVIMDDVVVFTSIHKYEIRLALREAHDMVEIAKRFHEKI